jgi:hypothetical protein
MRLDCSAKSRSLTAFRAGQSAPEEKKRGTAFGMTGDLLRREKELLELIEIRVCGVRHRSEGKTVLLPGYPMITL